jgi:7-carboxy-7-deazaguanine synthase
VRLTGCPLRCVWCDTEYAFSGGQRMTVGEVMDEVQRLGCPVVEVTGGEPLAQPNCIALLEELLAADYTVLLETSGANALDYVPTEVHRIMDLKCPDSGEQARNRMENIPLLTERDEVKFVIASRRDYEWARDTTRSLGLAQPVRAVLFSCVFGRVEPKDMVEWLLADKLHEVRFQLQAHKFIWPPDERGV